MLRCLILTVALVATPVLAAKPDNPGSNGRGKTKVVVCHYGEEDVVDENGNPVLDEDGEPVTEVVTSIINIPEKPAATHIVKHGDFVLEPDDEEGMALCLETLGEDDDNDAPMIVDPE